MGFCITCQKDVSGGRFCPTCGKQVVDVVFEQQAATTAANVSSGNQGMWAHLGALIGSVAGYFLFITWFALWLPGLIIKNSSTATDFDRRHAKESMNFQLSALVMLGFFLLGDLVLLLMGQFDPIFFQVLIFYALITLVIVVIVQILGIVCSIVGSLKASKLQEYRYPISYRFVK
ncbi:MAG: DUF4870 domain-containing protein [Acidobacteria bacterium]|nr:DUF4870 domain-containing protein [Acidobacteriota bacterium]